MKQRFFKLDSRWYAVLIVLSVFAAFIAVAGLSLMSAIEQVTYGTPEDTGSYDPDIFALDADRGELREPCQ